MYSYSSDLRSSNCILCSYNLQQYNATYFLNVMYVTVTTEHYSRSWSAACLLRSGQLPLRYHPTSPHYSSELKRTVIADPPSAMLKTSGNVLTLLLTGPPSSLSTTNTTSSSCLPASYLQPPITPNVSGKQSINSYTAILLTATDHFSWHFTCRQLCLLFHRQNILTPSVSHQQPHYIVSALTLSSCHSP